MAKFRAKARAVELLGKGQIADLPTAISELWKNGYDAYAKDLKCKLFLDTYKDNSSPIFLLSDNGFGMSENDILNKWFVLGTDSKARNQKIQSEFGLKKRTPMGEKGIGRLSVSYLGSQMLMLSKKKKEHANAFLMDWRVLDNYDFFLEDLNIPLFKFGTQDSFNSNFNQAKKDFSLNLDESLWREQESLRNNISTDLTNLKVPYFINEEVIKRFCDVDFHGTSFIVFTPHDQLLELSDKDRVEFKNNTSVNYLRSSLSGLHNDLRAPEKDFNVNFLIYDASGKYDLIDDFLTQEEMRNADHWLKGSFDKNGFFSGEIKIFNKREKYEFRPNRPPGKTAYGSFNIEWGAIEGNRASSSLNKEEYLNIDKKLSNFGGLYIYRDDFRVLPYGRTESDFLEFEKRRTLHAGQYFFSHRRFIGYIDIQRSLNPSLKDKAGREGFIQNKAYREFKDDLIEFFIDIAKRYMRSGVDDRFGTLRENQLSEIEAKHKKQLDAAKRKNKKTKKAFLSQLNDNKDSIVTLQNQIKILSKELQDEVSQIEINYNSYNRIIEKIEEAKNTLRILKVQKPHGVNITKRQESSYETYQHIYYTADEDIQECNKQIATTRERINAENLKLEFNEKYHAHIKYINKQFLVFQQTSKESFGRIDKLLGDEKESQIESFLEHTKQHSLSIDDSKEEITAKISALENLISEQKKLMENSFEGFINHITNLQIDVDDDFLREWYQEQNEKLNVKLKDYEELAQLGMSIEIIDHQFNVMYAQMNDAVKELKHYKSEDGLLENSVTQLKNAFQHLEVNYKLLRPLYRTSRRTREVINGSQISEYISSFFRSEFERFNIGFEVNPAFEKYEFFTFDSIIKPVFLNIINNANYWLISSEKREIKIDLIDDEILIRNSGARIDDTQLDGIFTLFYTRKKDGRGIGLYLAKKHLNSIGYDIRASNDSKYNNLNGACFVISKTKKD